MRTRLFVKISRLVRCLWWQLIVGFRAVTEGL